MREIKFKVWHKGYKTMINVRKLHFLGSRIKINDDIDFVLNMKGKENQNIELMQYTGIKDVNGKEIYEGDILSYKHIVYTDCSETEIEKVEDEAFIEIINYAPIASIIKAHSENVKCFAYDIINNQCLLIGLKSEEIEVIGNVYENEDLLEK